MKNRHFDDSHDLTKYKEMNENDLNFLENAQGCGKTNQALTLTYGGRPLTTLDGNICSPLVTINANTFCNSCIDHP